MTSVLMVSGPIGAGKTSVCRHLAEIWDDPFAYIEGDTFWSFLGKRKQGDRRADFRILMRSMTAAAAPFARTGYDVVLDFSFPLEFQKTAKAILKEIPLDLVVVRPSLEICAARAAARPAGKISDYDKAFYALFEGAGQHEISDDEADALTIAQRIRDGVSAGSFRVG